MSAESVEGEAVKQVDVVVIDDNEGICWIFEQALELYGLSCLAVGDGVRGAQEVIRANPRLAVIDIKLGPVNGFEVARLIRQRNSDVKIIFITGYREAITPEEWAGDRNVLGVLEKPFEIADLLGMVALAFEQPCS